MGTIEGERMDEPVRFDEFMTHAAAIFDQVAAGQQIVVQRNGELVRLSPARRRRKKPGRRFSTDDPLWDIVGAGRSTGPTDTSTRKHPISRTPQ